MLTLALTGDGPDALSQLFNVNPLDHKSRVYLRSVYGRFKNEDTKIDVEMKLNLASYFEKRWPWSAPTTFRTSLRDGSRRSSVSARTHSVLATWSSITRAFSSAVVKTVLRIISGVD